MSRYRNRRRFCPEFYTDDELNQREKQENEIFEECKKEELTNVTDITEIIEMPEMPEITEQSELVQEYYIRNNPDVAKIPEVPEVEKIIEKIEKIAEIPAEPLEITIEIPQDMYIREMQVEVPDEPEKIEEPDIFEEIEKIEKIEEIEEIEEIKESEEIEIEEDFQALPVFEHIPEPEPPEPKLELEPEIVAEEFSPEPEPEIVLVPDFDLIPFDREKAVEYARRWALDRNPQYYNFEEIGGDCTNYISQILLAGGCEMDRNSPLYGWYYNNANDKSPSWTGVEHLYNYLVKEKERGIIAQEIDVSEVAAGDIVQLSFNGKSFQHTPFIVSAKRGTSDEISFDRIKICAHTFDSENRALDTYQWKKIRFIRILGHKK